MCYFTVTAALFIAFDVFDTCSLSLQDKRKYLKKCLSVNN